MLRRLNQEVSLSGQNYFGINSKISFQPINNEKGWFWQYDSNESPIRITAKLLQYKKRRIILEYRGFVLNVFEHIAALKWCGFENMIISSDTWPPYFGRSWEYYQLLCKYSEKIRGESQWYTVDREINYQYKNSRISRSIQIVPSDKKQLELDVVCDYPSLGKKNFHLILPEQNYFLKDIFKTYSQGWPAKAFYLGWVASKVFKWPHLYRIIWPHKYPKLALELFCWHRTLDLLGALSIINSEGFFAAHIKSYCSGHLGDVEVVKKAQRFLIPI